MKAHVVAVDPHERTGLRATLNLGHTLAHALETVGGYELLHGEAVAVGLVFAGALAGALERIDADGVDRYRDVVASLDLPTVGARAAARASTRPARRSMRRDKKAVGRAHLRAPGRRRARDRATIPMPRALDVRVRGGRCGKLTPVPERFCCCRGRT